MHTIDSWVYPFKSRKVAEPVKAADIITYDLLAAEKKDNDVVSCVETRLKSSDTDLVAPLPKSYLQTFGNLVKSKSITSSATGVIVEANRGLFARMVVTAQH